MVLDEPHPTHIGRQLEDQVRILARAARGVLQLQIGDDILHVIEALIPLLHRLDIDRANPMSLRPEGRDQVPTDETPSPGHDCHLRHAVLL